MNEEIEERPLKGKQPRGKGKPAKNDFPLITRAALIADDVAALTVVPKCLAFAVVLDHQGDPFDYGSLTVLRPNKGKNADQVTLRTIRYAVLCELKRFGGSININISTVASRDGNEYLKSTYADGLGGNTTTVGRIFEDAQAGQTVRGAAHVHQPEPGGEVMPADGTTSGYSKQGGREVALAHADRYAGLHAPKGFDIPAYKANLMDLFAFHDELMSRHKAAKIIRKP
jgi:hypothetical protein